MKLLFLAPILALILVRAPVPAPSGGAISWTELTQGTGTDPTTTASISPTANSQVFVAVGVSLVGGAGTPADTITVSGCNLSWTQIGTTTYGTRRRIVVWRGTGASPTSGALTIDYTTDTNFEQLSYSVDQATGVNASTPIGTVITNISEAATSLALSSVGTIDAGDNVYAMFAEENAEAMTPESGTTLSNVTTGTGLRSLLAYYNLTDNTPSASWASSGSAAGIGFIVNISP